MGQDAIRPPALALQLIAKSGNCSGPLQAFMPQLGAEGQTFSLIGFGVSQHRSPESYRSLMGANSHQLMALAFQVGG